MGAPRVVCEMARMLDCYHAGTQMRSVTVSFHIDEDNLRCLLPRCVHDAGTVVLLWVGVTMVHG